MNSQRMLFLNVFGEPTRLANELWWHLTHLRALSMSPACGMKQLKYPYSSFLVVSFSSKCLKTKDITSLFERTFQFQGSISMHLQRFWRSDSHSELVLCNLFITWGFNLPSNTGEAFLTHQGIYMGIAEHAGKTLDCLIVQESAQHHQRNPIEGYWRSIACLWW